MIRISCTAPRAFAILLTAWLLGPTAASAQSYETARQWMGLYGGAHIGYAKAELEVDENYYSVGTANFSNVTGGILAGYNHQLGWSKVIGVEADLSWHNLDDKLDGDFYEIRHLATLRGRIGHLVTPSALVYLTAGLAYGEFRYSGEVIPPPPPPAPPAAAPPAPPPPPPPPLPPVNKSSNLQGYVIGGGIERFVNHRMRLRAEYIYMGFEDWNFAAGDDRYQVDPSAHVVRIGVVIPLNGF